MRLLKLLAERLEENFASSNHFLWISQGKIIYLELVMINGIFRGVKIDNEALEVICYGIAKYQIKLKKLSLDVSA